MNPLIQIKKWIENGKPYDEGIAIYEQHGRNAVLKDLFKKYKSNFYHQKLCAELVQIMNDLEVVADSTPKEIQASIIAVENPTQQQLDLNYEKAKLFRSILKTRQEIKKIIKLPTVGKIGHWDACETMKQKDKNGNLKPFSVTYMSYNSRTNKGGEILKFPHCVFRIENNTGSKVMKGKQHYKGYQPRHWENSTRNFLPLGMSQGNIKKLHVWLMFEFNGMEVVVSEQG